MCGICGFTGERNSDVLEKMKKSIAHRGPDDDSSYESEGINFGHLRLSIIDLSGGAQPIYNEDKSLVIIYNGELYNFPELKEELVALGHVFTTKSDTEVIVHAYEEWGVDCLPKLNGMFAFALWSTKTKELLLARDRMGIKPLYYATVNGEVIFGSEVKALLQHPSVSVELNYEALVDYLTYHYISGDKTYFSGVSLLEPAHYLLVKNGQVEKKAYWELSAAAKKHTTTEFHEALTRSVKRQMISDVPVGATLSGGFDSSSVATLASKMTDKKMSTFTMGFKEGGRYDERPLAHSVAKNLNVNIFDAEIDLDDFDNTMKKIMYHLDDPRNGAPTFSQYFLAELVGKHVKVVLTGHGGDELFAGYHVFKSFLYLDKMKKNPVSSLSLFSLFKHHEILRGMYFVGFSMLDPEVAKTGLFVNFNKAQRSQLFTPTFLEKIKDYDPSAMKETAGKETMTERALHAYMKIYLPTLLLVQDKMGMAHSIEARVPICDNEMVDFSLDLSMEDKLTNKELKYYIKESMKDDLPSALYNKPKKGFPTPFAVWFSGPLKEYLYKKLTSERVAKRGIFNTNYIKSVLDKYCNLKVDTPLSLIGVNKIWSLLTTELWFEVFVDGEKASFEDF